MSQLKSPPPIIYGVLIALKNNQNDFLLIKRAKEPYKGKWGMIGGKVELGETIEETAIRETHEESNLNGKYLRTAAFLNESIWAKNKPTMHFILAIAEMETHSTIFSMSEEGNLAWYKITDILQMKSQIIPSDYKILTEIINVPSSEKRSVVQIEAKIDFSHEDNIIQYQILK